MNMSWKQASAVFIMALMFSGGPACAGAANLARQADGSWGKLYGNLHQYPEPMLESNVFKDPGQQAL